jgi:hypothetical protein
MGFVSPPSFVGHRLIAIVTACDAGARDNRPCGPSLAAMPSSRCRASSPPSVASNRTSPAWARNFAEIDRARVTVEFPATRVWRIYAFGTAVLKLGWKPAFSAGS